MVKRTRPDSPPDVPEREIELHLGAQEPSAAPAQSAADAPSLPATSAPAAPGEGKSFEIEWFDEARPPQPGHIFMEAPPEPPLQPFEIVREPRHPHPDPQAAAAPHRAPAAALRAMGGSGAPARPAFLVRFFWGFMPIILLLAGYGSVILSQKTVGFAWDEAYYYEPSLKAADWLTDVLRGHRPFDRARIDAAWGDLHEHPSVQKFLSGISLRAFADNERQLWAMRFPIAILFGLSLSLIYLLGRRAWGPVPGLLSALIFATMPRIFGQAHFATMEIPLIFMMLLVVFCFLRGLDSPFWAAMTGLSFGLLLATKINGFFLPIPLILWAHCYARRRYANNLFAMLLVGPAVFVLAWPWLWPAPAQRLLEYFAFHAQHQQTALYFWGKIWGYGGPNAPWFYPWVILGVTVPLSGLILIVWGALRTLGSLTRRPIGTLYFLVALTMLGVASLPSTPKYDGERLFLPAFPFLALLGGSGAVGLLSVVQFLTARGRRQDLARQRRIWHGAAAALALIVLADGGGAIARHHPYELSYFNPVVGGLAGASRSGDYETTYWGEQLNDRVIDAINDLPDGSNLEPLAMNEQCLKDLQIWGLIKPEIQISLPKFLTRGNAKIPYYDYHLLQMRRGFFRRPERALAGSKTFPLVKSWDCDGVPLMRLYRTGPEFESYWPTLGPDPAQ